MQRTLSDCEQYFGKRPIICARELTKAFEEWSLREPPPSYCSGSDPIAGEFVLVIGAEPTVERRQNPDDAEVAAVFGRITENNSDSRRDAIRKTGDDWGFRRGTCSTP